MANTTKFLPVAAFGNIESKMTVASNIIDFSKQNVAIDGTFDALKIPQGAVVVEAGFVVHTTQATVTIGLGDQTTAGQYLAATTLTDVKADADAAEGAAMATDTATDFQKFYAAEDTLRGVVAGAAATTAKITAFAVYFMIPLTAVAAD